ncbi:MAG: hypothetical protein ACRDST_16460 [Pseudonocardiaceae bacterium]
MTTSPVAVRGEYKPVGAGRALLRVHTSTGQEFYFGYRQSRALRHHMQWMLAGPVGPNGRHERPGIDVVAKPALDAATVEIKSSEQKHAEQGLVTSHRRFEVLIAVHEVSGLASSDPIADTDHEVREVGVEFLLVTPATKAQIA